MGHNELEIGEGYGYLIHHQRVSITQWCVAYRRSGLVKHDGQAHLLGQFVDTTGRPSQWIEVLVVGSQLNASQPQFVCTPVYLLHHPHVIGVD